MKYFVGLLSVWCTWMNLLHVLFCCIVDKKCVSLYLNHLAQGCCNSIANALEYPT